MFKIGQVWRSRNGECIKIINFDNTYLHYPMHGFSKCRQETYDYTEKGTFFAFDDEVEPHDLDLIELVDKQLYPEEYV